MLGHSVGGSLPTPNFVPFKPSFKQRAREGGVGDPVVGWVGIAQNHPK